MSGLLENISEIISLVIGFITGYSVKYVRGSKDVSSENTTTQEGNEVIGGTQAGRDANVDR
jgi:hypothetical protein